MFFDIVIKVNYFTFSITVDDTIFSKSVAFIVLIVLNYYYIIIINI